MSLTEKSKIDLVVTYVDGNDPEWLKEKSQFDGSNEYLEGDTAQRYRSIPFFNYWFRAVENFAPWVNKVFFVTYGHVPVWLNTNHPKLRIVKHKDYIPEEYLPTYNSNVIELNLHRIPDLSEQFVLFNDDMFLNRTVKPEDFFLNGKVKDYAIYAPLVPREEFNHIELNNTIVINKYFEAKSVLKRHPLKFFNIRYKKYIVNNLFASLYKGIFGYKNFHVSLPHLKSTFKEVWEKEGELLDKVCHNRFRNIDDVNHFLMSNWNIERNQFEPQKVGFGSYYSLEDTEGIAGELLNPQHCVICLNDDVNDLDFDKKCQLIVASFERKFPHKSSFEN
ncbi:Stealth CR1 domain-containing protein [Streptococcus orisasini]|uniref:Stealth CR1 domain-containing protein n=1 Tax=Streptococcus orisasini TaxID=1080071 RepID=UPI00070DD927|nr:Stealth CR1 domain-containing protein [Streptococcus orisasini]